MSAEQGQFLGKPPERQPKLAVVIGGELYFSFGLTRQFLKRSIEEEAHQHPPQVLERNVEIVKRYIKTDDTHEEIGREYGLTRSRSQQIIVQTVRRLWQNCSPQTQRLFPINEIPLRKPRSQQSRERTSWSRGGRSGTIIRILQEKKTLAEIRREPVITQRELRDYSRKLKKWGFGLPYDKPPLNKVNNKELADKLAKPNLSDTEIQELLNQVSRGFIQRIGSSREQPLLTPVKHIISNCGFRHREMQPFIDSLRAAGIPTGKLERVVKSGAQRGYIQRYHFITTRHLERAKAALKSDPDLKRFLKP